MTAELREVFTLARNGFPNIDGIYKRMRLPTEYSSLEEAQAARDDLIVRRPYAEPYEIDRRIVASGWERIE